jgi:hypothetical protein
MTTRETPVLRAYATFSWAPPMPGPAPDETVFEFAVALDSTGKVILSTPVIADLVTGLRWLEASDAVDPSSGRWSPKAAWDAEQRAHLLLTVTNVLRTQMQLPPRTVTAEHSGAE